MVGSPARAIATPSWRPRSVRAHGVRQRRHRRSRPQDLALLRRSPRHGQRSQPRAPLESTYARGPRRCAPRVGSALRADRETNGQTTSGWSGQIPAELLHDTGSYPKNARFANDGTFVLPTTFGAPTTENEESSPSGAYGSQVEVLSYSEEVPLSDGNVRHVWNTNVGTVQGTYYSANSNKDTSRPIDHWSGTEPARTCRSIFKRRTHRHLPRYAGSSHRVHRATRRAAAHPRGDGRDREAGGRRLGSTKRERLSPLHRTRARVCRCCKTTMSRSIPRVTRYHSFST